jgi:hypothetical protein
MPQAVFETYRKSIEPLKASESLDFIACISHPHKKAEGQKEMIKALNKPLKPFTRKKSYEEVEAEMRRYLG